MLSGCGPPLRQKLSSKQLLTSDSSLVHCNPSKELNLMHYASPYRVEAVLSHADEQGVEKLVVYTL